MAYYSFEDLGKQEIRMTKGNTKIGKSVWSFSTLPGYNYITTKDKGVLLEMHGTCKGVCKDCENGGCYAIRDARRFHTSALKAWAMNTHLMRKQLHATMISILDKIQTNHIKTLRWNVAGEIENYEQLIELVWLAHQCPHTTIYFYTKRFDFIEKYTKYGLKFPKNLVCNISRWHDNTKDRNFDGLNIFAYDDGSDEELKSWVHCPAVDKTGHETGVTCDKCRRCMQNKGNKTAVFAH